MSEDFHNRVYLCKNSLVLLCKKNPPDTTEAMIIRVQKEDRKAEQAWECDVLFEAQSKTTLKEPKKGHDTQSDFDPQGMGPG